MDNVDNRTQTRPPCGEEEAAPCCSFAPCAAFALSLDVSPAPFFSYSRRPKPQHRQDRRGGATPKRRPIWQRPALRLYDTRTTARALRIENAPKDEESGAGAASTQPARMIDNVDNMDTTARRVEATQARGSEYRKSKRPPPTNRERPKPQIKNERPKEQRARLCTNTTRGKEKQPPRVEAIRCEQTRGKEIRPRLFARVFILRRSRQRGRREAYFKRAATMRANRRGRCCAPVEQFKQRNIQRGGYFFKHCKRRFAPRGS